MIHEGIAVIRKEPTFFSTAPRAVKELNGVSFRVTLEMINNIFTVVIKLDDTNGSKGMENGLMTSASLLYKIILAILLRC